MKKKNIVQNFEEKDSDYQNGYIDALEQMTDRLNAILFKSKGNFETQPSGKKIKTDVQLLYYSQYKMVEKLKKEFEETLTIRNEKTNSFNI